MNPILKTLLAIAIATLTGYCILESANADLDGIALFRKVALATALIYGCHLIITRIKSGNWNYTKPA